MDKNRKNKISVITVVKNSVYTIEKTIKSVLDQKYENIEYIIIDGKSDDGTNKILKKFENKVSLIVSENDNGIWDAMNKGLKLATGEIVTFLNSDDFYYPGALNTVNNYFNNNNIDFLFGSVKKYKILSGYNPNIIKWSFGFYTSHSIGFFIKKEKHLYVGNYNTKYLSADLDFFYKMIIKKNLKGIATKKDEILGEFTSGGFSSKVNYIDHLKDLNKIRLDNGQNLFFVNFLFFIKILKKPLRFIKSIIYNK